MTMHWWRRRGERGGEEREKEEGRGGSQGRRERERFPRRGEAAEDIRGGGSVLLRKMEREKEGDGEKKRN